MSSKRFTEEFKKEAVKQVSERGYSVAEVAERLGTTTHSLYAWLKKYGEPNPRQSGKEDNQAEIARLKTELHRVTKNGSQSPNQATDPATQEGGVPACSRH